MLLTVKVFISSSRKKRVLLAKGDRLRDTGPRALKSTKIRRNIWKGITEGALPFPFQFYPTLVWL